MVEQVVSFIADKPAPPPAPDAWPWQAHVSYRIRSFMTRAGARRCGCGCLCIPLDV